MNKNIDIEDLELRISTYLSGNCTEEEKQSLLVLLASDDHAAKIFREMSAVWAISSVPAFAEREDENLQFIHKRISLSPSFATKVVRPRPALSIWLKVAAAVLLLLGCNYVWYTYTENLTEEYTSAESSYEIKVPAGSRTHIMLPDGTEVSLNAGSALRYSRAFGVRDRKVTLDGEGYFKVAKNEKIPFFVNNNDIQVRVVGTEFNVRGYKDDSYVLVSLLEGRVNLTALSGSTMNLLPDEQALYNKRTRRMEKMKSDAANACDWLDGGLMFENAPFVDIAHRLERKFQMKIKIESECLKTEHYSGSFNSNQGIRDILEEINVEKQYIWKMKGDTIVITDRKGGATGMK